MLKATLFESNNLKKSMMLQLGAREIVDYRFVSDDFQFRSASFVSDDPYFRAAFMETKNMVRLVNYRYVCTYITILSLCVSLLFEFISIFRNIIMDITHTSKKRPKND